MSAKIDEMFWLRDKSLENINSRDIDIQFCLHFNSYITKNIMQIENNFFAIGSIIK
jgi:hypothetical protein